jgi:hypothetical protein
MRPPFEEKCASLFILRRKLGDKDWGARREDRWIADKSRKEEHAKVSVNTPNLSLPVLTGSQCSPSNSLHSHRSIRSRTPRVGVFVSLAPLYCMPFTHS